MQNNQSHIELTTRARELFQSLCDASITVPTKIETSAIMRFNNNVQAVTVLRKDIKTHAGKVLAINNKWSPDYAPYTSIHWGKANYPYTVPEIIKAFHETAWLILYQDEHISYDIIQAEFTELEALWYIFDTNTPLSITLNNAFKDNNVVYLTDTIQKAIHERIEYDKSE